jgi:hypothetical protein
MNNFDVPLKVCAGPERGLADVTLERFSFEVNRVDVPRQICCESKSFFAQTTLARSKVLVGTPYVLIYISN